MVLLKFPWDRKKGEKATIHRSTHWALPFYCSTMYYAREAAALEFFRYIQNREEHDSKTYYNWPHKFMAQILLPLIHWLSKSTKLQVWTWNQKIIFQIGCVIIMQKSYFTCMRNKLHWQCHPLDTWVELQQFQPWWAKQQQPCLAWRISFWNWGLRHSLHICKYHQKLDWGWLARLVAWSTCLAANNTKLIKTTVCAIKLLFDCAKQ